MGTTVLLALLALTGQTPPEGGVLVAGQDVEPPRKLYSPPPVYPMLARQAQMQGLIILGVTANEDGRPTDIRVLRGIPILNEAAIDAIKTWRYAPTTVNGVARRVKFVEHVDFYLSDRERVRAYTRLAQDRQVLSPLRLFAISQLLHIPREHHKQATEALAAAAKDPDPSVATAAKTALEQLATGGR